MRLRCIPLIFLIILLSSCAINKISDLERAQIGTVNLMPVTLNQDAYTKPDAKGESGLTEAASSTGLIGLGGVLVAAAVDEGIKGRRQGKFEKQNKQYFSAIRQIVPETIHSDVQSSLIKSLSDQSSSLKIDKNSEYKLKVGIENYGLKGDVTASKDRTLMHFYIQAKIELFKNEERVWSMLNLSESETGETLEAYTKNHSLLLSNYNNAIDVFVKSFFKEF